MQEMRTSKPVSPGRLFATPPRRSPADRIAVRATPPCPSLMSNASRPLSGCELSPGALGLPALLDILALDAGRTASGYDWPAYVVGDLLSPVSTI